MHEIIKEKVGVIMIHTPDSGSIRPGKILWRGRERMVTKVGYHHKIKQGVITHHIYSVTDGNTFYRLDLDTDSLLWTLEEISDGVAD